MNGNESDMIFFYTIMKEKAKFSIREIRKIKISLF